MNLPVPVTTQMSWGMAEQDRAARTAAAISGFDSELQRMEQSEAELIQDLTDLQQRIKEVRGKHADAGRALADAQQNVRISQEMVKSWCVANEVPVPDFPELTQPFRPVPPRSAPSLNPQTALSAWCKNCRQQIVRSTPAHDWCHTDGLGLTTCYPDAVVSPEADPDLDQPDPAETRDDAKGGAS